MKKTSMFETVLIKHQTMNQSTYPILGKENFVLKRVENIMGKGENAVYQHFLLFPHCFQKTVYTGFIFKIIADGQNIGETLCKFVD